MKLGICAVADPCIPSVKWCAHHDTTGCANILSGNIDFFSQYIQQQFLSCSLIKVLGNRRVRENVPVFFALLKREIIYEAVFGRFGGLFIASG